MKFGTVINCMDGRVQIPVLTYLQQRFKVDYIDSITEPGPIKALSSQLDSPCSKSILERLDISLTRHGSVGVAIVGHYDCAGNPVSKEVQHQQVADSMTFVMDQRPDVPVIGLWVDENWVVHEISSDGKTQDA